MTPQPERALAAMLRDMIVERQRLLIREANYLRGLVGLPPARAEKERDGEAMGDAVGDENESGPGYGHRRPHHRSGGQGSSTTMRA